jgi:hypothetical protein
VIDDEEYRARIKAFADANSMSTAQLAEGMGRLTAAVASSACSFGELTASHQRGARSFRILGRLNTAGDGSR